MFKKLSGIVRAAPVPVVVVVVVGHGARSEPVEYDCDREGPVLGIAVILPSEVVVIAFDVGVPSGCTGCCCAVVGLMSGSAVPEVAEPPLAAGGVTLSYSSQALKSFESSVADASVVMVGRTSTFDGCCSPTVTAVTSSTTS